MINGNGAGPYGVATNSNRTSQQGSFPLAKKYGQSSAILTLVIPAGHTNHIPYSGDKFYIIAASAAIYVQPEGQIENLYYPGTGLEATEANTFSMLYVRNPGAAPLLIQIFVGFDSYTDKRLNLTPIQFSRVMHPVYDWVHPALSGDNPAGVATKAIPDLSGTVITDGWGDDWYAINRELLYVFNSHATIAMRLGVDVVGPGSRYLGECYPGTALQIPMTGDIEANGAGANITGFISELYNCLPVPA
jgi:hypothetical protein